MLPMTVFSLQREINNFSCPEFGHGYLFILPVFHFVGCIKIWIENRNFNHENERKKMNMYNIC